MFDFIFHLTFGDWLIIAMLSAVMWVGVRWFCREGITRAELVDALKHVAPAARKAFREEFGWRILGRCKGDPVKIAAAIKERPWLRTLTGRDHGA